MTDEQLAKLNQLIEIRGKNREQGWRKTADIIGQHILDKTPALDFSVLLSSLHQDPDDAPNTITKIKIKHINEYAQRLNDALAIVMYSWDDDHKTVIAALRHLIHHWRIFDAWDYDEDITHIKTVFTKIRFHDQFFDNSEIINYINDAGTIVGSDEILEVLFKKTGAPEIDSRFY
jgi:hypothetical protein